MGELPKRFEQQVEEVEAAVDEQVSDREPSGGIHLDNMAIIVTFFQVIMMVVVFSYLRLGALMMNPCR